MVTICKGNGSVSIKFISLFVVLVGVGNFVFFNTDDDFSLIKKRPSSSDVKLSRLSASLFCMPASTYSSHILSVDA